YTVDMSWNKGQLAEADIHSNIGGRLRIRSYVPLEGEGLVVAEGDCPNPLLAPVVMADAVVSAETSKEYPMLLKVYEYDLDTTPGQTYKISRAK
ncbi:MAG: glycoside hydrolase family 95 protein, partial [Muribaculaceae bacterium]|nr:glycoside hydrolase family 95 protein [Muribaculaceae bacterium]